MCTCIFYFKIPWYYISQYRPALRRQIFHFLLVYLYVYTGKLQTLDILLRRLKTEGHRCTMYMYTCNYMYTHTHTCSSLYLQALHCSLQNLLRGWAKERLWGEGLVGSVQGYCAVSIIGNLTS